jgi:hypothetical protein
MVVLFKRNPSEESISYISGLTSFCFGAIFLIGKKTCINNLALVGRGGEDHEQTFGHFDHFG